jgi:hypothetical protein
MLGVIFNRQLSPSILLKSLLADESENIDSSSLLFLHLQLEESSLCFYSYLLL